MRNFEDKLNVMGGSLFGKHLQLMTFGESHGPAIGGVIDGFPAGIPVDYSLLREEMRRRKPRNEVFETTRKEKDEVEILSGILDGVSLGTPIAFIIRNENQNPADYRALSKVFRPGHADFTWERKYGFRDYRGGGRASARETAARVAAGAFAKMLLQQHGILVYGFVNAIGEVSMPNENHSYQVPVIEKSAVRCPDADTAIKMEQALENVAKDGDSLGGIVTCVVKNLPAGIGEPVFDKLDSLLAQAVMSIPAVKGFEIGKGFDAATMKGSENNDPFVNDDGKIHPGTNNAGGVNGGISTGEDVILKAAIKPVSSIKSAQHTVNSDGTPIDLTIKGRHDACVAPRAVPVIEAMVSLALADLLLRQELNIRYREL